ncbi:MAG: PKD domain-containing protein [Thermoplasmata archaeon]
MTHVRTKTLFYSIESNTSQEDGIQWNRPDYLIPLVDYKRGLSEVPIGTDLVKASAYFDYFDFDPDWDYGIENRYSLALYDWWDEDGDGLYWNDSNGDGVVQREEIDGYPNFSEIKRFVDSGQAANRYEARVHNPHQRIHDGLLIGVFHTRTTAMRPVTNVSIRVDSYELMDCNWLDVSASTLAIPPGGRSSFQATVAFPSDAGLGLYEAFLLLSYDSNETAVPITANLAADSSDFLISESSGELYDNGAVFGGYNWGWRYESGDWRFYFLDVPEGSFKQGQQLVVNVSWEHVPTDVDVFLLGGEIDDFSTNHPERYGPYYMETRGGSEDYWAGAGKFLFNTVTGGPQEIVAADLSPGLWEIVLHNVLNAGRSSIENISVDVGTIEINPNPWEIGLVRDFSRLVGRQQFITNSSLNLPDIEVSSFGVSQPIQFTEETILQDNPSDPSTSSWSYELDIQDGGLLEVYTDSARPIDIDLYLLRDENSNGLPDWGTEIIASSTSPTEKESVSIKRPSNGKYWVFVHGWSIGGFSSTFDISIDAIQGRDIGVSEVPTGPIVAYEPVSFNASYSLPAVDGLYHGIIFAGPSSAPGVLSVRFYGEVRDYPPEFYNLTPPPGSIVNNNQPMIGADFLDTGSGMNLSSLQLFVDGFNISNLANITRDSISWSTPFLLTEGPHWVSISARDNFGNENLTTWSFTVDTFPPYLNVVEPIDGLVTRISLLSVSGWTENDASLTINEVPTPVSPNGSFSAFVVLTEGKNVISVQSRDRAGNYERINRTVVLDTIPPLLDVTEPSDGVWINYPTVVVRGRTEPGALISVGGQLADVGPNGSFEMSVALIEGPNRITVTATDPAGNIATSQISVNVDTKPPYLLLESPREGLLTNMQSLSIYGGTEPSVSLEINGVSMPVHPDGSFSTTALLSEGQNIIYVNVTDLAGNSNSIQRVVTLDSIEPPLEILKPVEGLVTTHHSIRLQGRSEPNVSLMVNSQLFLVESDGSFDVVLALSEGINTLLVRVCDMANNCNNDQRTVLVDSAPPTADAGEDSVVFVGMEYRFDGSGSTDNDRIVSYYWFFTEGGTEIKLEGSSPSYLFDEMDEYEIVLIVTDRAGNMDEDVLRITVVSRYDSDSDKLLDAWENDYFGGLDYDALDDPDLDGLSNYAELMKGSDPTNPDSDGDGIVDGLDDYPLQRKGLRVEDFWWLFVLITVALLVLTIYLQLRIRKISSGEGVELSKETETSKEKEVKEPTTKEGRS